MPCMKCSNGKYKYGEHGKCVYDSLAECKRAAAAIHINDKSLDNEDCESCKDEIPMQDIFKK